MNYFDFKFYINLYPDLNRISCETNAYLHYTKFGKKEGRFCNVEQLKKNYYKNLSNQIDKFKLWSDNNLNENKINIIIRTHLRKNYFKKVIESIINQNYQNYIIHVAYDHEDSLEYINENLNNKMILYKVERTSDNNAFFDLYCNYIKEIINDGWIMFLDDDNYLINSNCLKIINSYLNVSIIVWSFLRPDKLIKPKLNNLIYGEIDNCSYIFHNSIKHDSKFQDFYGSDFQFISTLINKNKSILIDYTIVATQYDYKISNYNRYISHNNKFIELDRIDFADYKNHYKDLQHLSLENLREHYNKYGKYESRIIKFLDFDYDIFKTTINHYLTYYKSNMKFILITTLYNESNETRIKEYIICLKHHQKNQFIEKIVIFYDSYKGDNKILKKCFETLSKLEVVGCIGRPYFIDLFKYSNKHCNNKNIIICNSDIIFDHTLHKFEYIDFKDKLYALTRWEYIDEKTAKPRFQNGKIMNSSKDTWIFQTPFSLDKVKNKNKFKEIQIGKWNCDGALNYFFKDKIVFECLNIKSYHVHFCNERTEKDSVIIY